MTAFAAWALMGSPVAKAGPDEAALIAQVKQLASQGQSPQTAAQVDQFVDQNQDVISAFLKMYMNYLKQMQAAGDDGTAPAAQPSQTPPASAQPAEVQKSGGGNAANGGDASNTASAANAASQSGSVQASGGLRISPVQASGELRTAHLAGYPSLPAVDPVSSVSGLTAAQMAYAARVQKDVEERKQYLMQHPEGYTY